MRPSGSSSRIEITASLSRVIAVTVSGRKPDQAGGGLVAASPALPLPGSSSSRARNEACQPGLSGGDPQRSEQLLARVPGEVQQRVDLGDGHLFGAGGELDDLVSRLYVAFFEHAEVEARAVVRDEHRGDARVVHPDPDAVARDAGLRDLEDGVADPVAIADAHLVIGESVHGEVLAELAVDEVVSSELAFPVPVRVDLVNEHRALLPAVPGEIALTIALDVERSDAAGADHGILEDAGENRPSPASPRSSACRR